MQASAVAHPNVALIKYWGKQDVVENIPAVGSLSLTLAGLETRTTVSFDSSLESDQVQINGEIDQRASAQAQQCLDLLRRQADCDLSARIESTNNFPTAAGLASSASGCSSPRSLSSASSSAGLLLPFRILLPLVMLVPTPERFRERNHRLLLLPFF